MCYIAKGYGHRSWGDVSKTYACKSTKVGSMRVQSYSSSSSPTRTGRLSDYKKTDCMFERGEGSALRC